MKGVVKVQLDSEAVREIFKSREAQVELQSAVIADISQRYLKGIINECNETIKSEMVSVYNKLSTDEFGKIEWHNKYRITLNDNLKSKLKDAAILESKSVMDDLIKVTVPQIIHEMDIRFNILIDEYLDRKIDEYFKTKLDHKLTVMKNKIDQLGIF